MHSARIAGIHTLPTGDRAEVIISGCMAEVRGSDRNGRATYTVCLPVSRVSELLAEAIT